MDIICELTGYRSATRKPVAVLSWTTATGDVSPLMYKVADEHGDIQTIKLDCVLSTKKIEQYSHTIWSYQCEATINETKKQFALIYLAGNMTWEVVIE